MQPSLPIASEHRNQPRIAIMTEFEFAGGIAVLVLLTWLVTSCAG